MDLLAQRRIWVALIPAVVIAANAFGVPITDDMLTTVSDKVIVAAMAALSLFSYFKPKPPA